MSAPTALNPAGRTAAPVRARGRERGNPAAAPNAPAPVAAPAIDPALAAADAAAAAAAAVAGAAAVAKTGYDLRNSPRLMRYSIAELLRYPAGRHQHPIYVQVVDYSSTGIGIVHDEGLLIGQQFVVREPHVTSDKTCLYTVVRSTRRADGLFSIGLHMHNYLHDEHDPLLAIEPAPGLSRASKLLYAGFALIGSLAIVHMLLG